MLTNDDVLSDFPSPIAIQYKRASDEAETWIDRANACNRVFEFGIRSLVLGILSGYVQRDINRIYDTNLENLLRELSRSELSYWIALFDSAMNTYYNKRDLFFVVELYDAYWNDDDRSLKEAIHAMSDQYNRYFALYFSERDKIDEAFFQEIWHRLNTLLQCMSFFVEYDLLHVTTIDDTDTANYYVYRGTEPKLTSGHFADQSVRSGGIYLRNGSGHLLTLNPFFASYPVDFDSVEFTQLQIDIGLLYAFLREDLNAFYLLALNDQSSETNKNLDSLEMLLNKLESKTNRADRADLKDFIWENLRNAAARISAVQMEAASQKYDPDTYLNRQAVDNAFGDFLRGAATGFVLLGKSGVGKSNFVVAQVGEKLDTQDNAIAFLIDGGLLDSQDVLATIYEELRGEINTGMSEYDGAAFLERLGEVSREQSRSILIVVDAINENEAPADMMALLNQWILYTYRHDLRHIKFVITSRPQAWRNIRRGTKIDQIAYYKPVEHSDLTFELKGFGVQMSEFDVRSELKEVYDRYAKKYGVVTPLDELPHNIRDALRDPLILKLVMRTYGDASTPERPRYIPTGITSHTIIEQYITDLREEQIVLANDFRLLTETLVPMMCPPDGKYRNYVTRYDITKHGEYLVEAIFNDAVIDLGDGQKRKVNQSFSNLLNAEILILQRRGGTGSDDEIRFKYERFYDYFIHKFLSKSLEAKTDDERKAAYISLSKQLGEVPYLWGPLFQQVLGDCQDNRWDLIHDLCFTEDSRLKDLLTAVLAEYGDRAGAESLSSIEQLASRLFDTTLRESPTDISGGYLQAVSIAVLLAYNFRLREVFLQGLLNSEDFILDSITDMLIALFLQNENSQPGDTDIAIGIVLEASSKLRLYRLRQFRKVSRNLLILCLAVFLLEYKNRSEAPARWSKITAALQVTLANIFKRIPGLNLGGQLRRLIILGFANFAVYIATVLSRRGGFIMDLSSISDFFTLSKEERNKYRVFIDNMNPDDAESLLRMLEQPARDLITDRQLVASYMTMLPLFAAMRHDSDAVNQFITDLFDHAFEILGPTTGSDNLTGTVQLANHLITLRNSLIPDKHISPNFKKLANFRHVFEHNEKLFWSRYATTVSETKWMDIITYYHFADKLNVEPDFDLIRRAIRDRLQRPDVDETLWYFIHEVIVIGFHPVLGNVEMASELIHIMLEEIPLEHIQRNRETLIESLLLMRFVAEYRTDIMLQEIPSTLLPEDIKQAVLTGTPSFDIGGRVGFAGSWFVRDVMLDDDPRMRKYLQWFLYTALEAKNEREWLLPMMNMIIDGILTGKFPDPDDLLKPHQKVN